MSDKESWWTSTETRAHDLRESADDAERMALCLASPGAKQILSERAARLRAWADAIGPDKRSQTVAMTTPPPPSETKLSEALDTIEANRAEVTRLYDQITPDSVPPDSDFEKYLEPIRAARSSLESLYRELLEELAETRRDLGDANVRVAELEPLLSALRSLQPRPMQTSVQWEPPYPDHETAIVSIRYPYHTAHKPTKLCAIQEPHLIEDCGEFER